jgi:hypothetical protein
MRAWITALAIIGAVSLCGFAITKKVNEGYIVNVGSWWFDPVGELEELKTRAFRSCAGVSKQSLASTDATEIYALLEGLGSGSPTLKQLVSVELRRKLTH